MKQKHIKDNTLNNNEKNNIQTIAKTGIKIEDKKITKTNVKTGIKNENKIVIQTNAKTGIKNEDKKDIRTNDECKINSDSGTKIGKQIVMIFDFLRFCKNRFHPIVHASKKDINHYLLPRNLFSSNIKYADYIFFLNDIINCNEIEKEDKNENNVAKISDDKDFKLYEEKKYININEALD